MVDTQRPTSTSVPMPSLERIQQELGSARSIDDFFGKEGIFARLFAHTLEHMLEAELTAHLGYERHAAEGRNAGNSRNGKRTRTLRTSASDTTLQVSRDGNSSFQSPLRDPYQTISTVTDMVWGLVEAWQNRPLAAIYPIIYLDAIHLKLRRDGRVQNTAVYVVLGVDLEGQRVVTPTRLHRLSSDAAVNTETFDLRPSDDERSAS